MDQIKKKLASLKKERDDAFDKAEEAKNAEKDALEKVNQVGFPTGQLTTQFCPCTGQYCAVDFVLFDL